MKAMVFAAGIGSRLVPWTLQHPKALAPVAGVPALERVLMRLKSAGVDRAVVNVHHFADQIEEFLAANGNFGLNLTVSDERSRLLDTGGGLLRAIPLLDDGSNEPILLHNADIVTDVPLERMAAAHNANAADATLLVSPIRSSSRMLYFDATRRLRGWRNLKTGETRPEGFGNTDDATYPAAFNGVHIVNPTLFPLLKRYGEQYGEVFSITPFYLDILDRAIIRGYAPSAPYRWHDIGSPSKLETASADFAQT